MGPWASFTFPYAPIKNEVQMRNRQNRTFRSLAGRGHFGTKNQEPLGEHGILNENDDTFLHAFLTTFTFLPLFLPGQSRHRQADDKSRPCVKDGGAQMVNLKWP